MLNGKNILLGITGGIAAYKTTFLVRLFIKAGANVKVILTDSASSFVSPLTLATLSKNAVVTDFVKFEGNTVGIAIASGKDAGTIEYRIDKKEWTTLNLFGNWGKNLHNPRYITLAAGLTKEAHELEIRIADTKDPRSAGNACRIRYFFVNRN